jgi:hypothetical protein
MRELTAADRAALETFTCARVGQAWAEAVQRVIREDLPTQIDLGEVSAVGLFDDHGSLCGVAAWRIHSSQVTQTLCRSDVIAVAIGHQRKGYGLALKRAEIERAKTAGAVAVASIVDRRNVAMIELNKRVGAVIGDADDPADCTCFVSLIDARDET